ncbi:MAG: hypothetical protein ACRDTX_11440 [Pseudonocardiaceae bacterium]
MRFVAAAGLAYDAYAHFDLSRVFDANAAVVSQGMLFRGEALIAFIAAFVLLITRSRAVAAFAVLVAGSALAAVLLYSYVDVGPLGPLPDMYEPTWYPEKTVSAVAEAVAVLAAGMLALFRTTTARRPSPR